MDVAVLLERLLVDLDARFGPHPAFGRESDPLWYSPAYLRNVTDALVRGAAARADVLDDLMERVPDWRELLPGHWVFCHRA